MIQKTFDGKMRIFSQKSANKIMAGYMGDKATMIVHHLANVKPECGVYYSKMKNREYFTPDILENAKSKKYECCKFCINQIQSHRDEPGMERKRKKMSETRLIEFEMLV